jgi:hypothetical protein
MEIIQIEVASKFQYSVSMEIWKFLVLIAIVALLSSVLTILVMKRK